MSIDDLTDGQKNLLRSIIQKGDTNDAPEKGYLHIQLGDDKYIIFGYGIELQSLGDLDALCDEDLLEKMDADIRHPIYRIKNAARKTAAFLDSQTATESIHEGQKAMEHLDIFISHSNRDKDIAEALVRLLRDALPIQPERIRCTSVEGYRLAAGAVTADQLRRDILGTKIVVGLVTEASMRSAYVLFELGAGWGANRTIIPLLARGATSTILRGPLEDRNALTCDNSAQLHQLVTDIGTQLKLTPNVPSVYQSSLESLVKCSNSGTNVVPTTESIPTAQPSSVKSPSYQHHVELSKLRELMPELLAEMRDDLGNDKTRLVREFVILPSKNVMFKHDKDRFEYTEDQHTSLRNKVDYLKQKGFVIYIQGSVTPIYSMTEDFVDLLLSTD